MPDSGSLPEIKISELPVADTVTGTDQIELNQAGVSRSGTIAQIAATVPPPDLSDYVTDEELAAIIAGIPPPPTTLPPSGAAGGDLAGTYPNPTLQPIIVPAGPVGDATHTPVITVNAKGQVTTLSVAAITGAPTVPAGSVAYGGAGGAISGDLANFSWDATNKRLGVGTNAPNAAATFVSGSAGGKVFTARGLGSGAAQDFVEIIIDDPTGGGGDIFRVMGGAGGGSPLYQVDRAGDTQVSGWHRALSLTTPLTGGADYFAYTLGNGVGGNIGLYAGYGPPTFQTYGAKGAIYMDMTGAVPWYNVDGAFTWAKVGTGSGGSTITVSDTAPGSPAAGALWWNSVLGTMFIFYNDGNSSQWVPAVPSASAANISAGDVLVYMPVDVPINTASNVALCNTGSIGLAGQKWEIEGVALIASNSGTQTIAGVNIFDGTTLLAGGGGVMGWAQPGWGVTSMCKAQKVLSGPTTFTLRGTGNATGCLASANGQGGFGATWISARRLS